MVVSVRGWSCEKKSKCLRMTAAFHSSHWLPEPAPHPDWLRAAVNKERYLGPPHPPIAAIRISSLFAQELATTKVYTTLASSSSRCLAHTISAHICKTRSERAITPSPSTTTPKISASSPSSSALASSPPSPAAPSKTLHQQNL